MKKNIAIAFLSNVLNVETYNFGMKIQKELNVTVYFINDCPHLPEVMIEDINFDPTNIIYIEDNLCKENGYINCMITGEELNTVLNKTPIAYDKMIYYFCEKNLEVDFLFMFEDDVFIPSVDIVKNLIEKYNDYDLITSNNFYKSDDVLDWHWKNIMNKINPPYYYSMVSAMGISRKVFDCIKLYVKKNNTLFFTEVMFNTIAMQNDLKVTEALELKSVVWMGEWNIDEFLLLPNNVFHPKKDLSSFGAYRLDIEKKRNSKYKPKNNNIPYWILGI